MNNPVPQVPEIEDITLKVLQIPEVSSTTAEAVLPAVLVTLEKGAQAYPNADFYLGI
ncbi:MAG: hypothetical protein JKX81_18505, partial [Arenicella sp.]|nr:hypothetical protein [Arenicella sp.]